MTSSYAENVFFTVAEMFDISRVDQILVSSMELSKVFPRVYGFRMIGKFNEFV